MNQRDKDVLDAMHQTFLKFLSQGEIDSLHLEVEKAGGITNTTGVARELLEKSAAIMAGAVAARSFGGNRSAAASYAARMRWGSSSSADGKAPALQGRTASPVGSAGWKSVDDAGKQALSDLGPDHPERGRVTDAVQMLGQAKRADGFGEKEVIPSSAQRAAGDAQTASVLLGLVRNKANVPASVGKFADIVKGVADSLTERTK